MGKFNRVEHITSEFNRFSAPTETENLKEGDIFESKVKLLQAIAEWSIQRGVSFVPVKSNKSRYTAVCASSKEGENKSRDVCPWRLHAFVPKNSSGYFKIGRIKGGHTSITPSLKSNHHKATSSFVRNVILYTVRKQLDISPGFIIKYIEGKYHISITYSKAWNARTKALMKIIGDWESSYETLPKYLDVVKASNLGTVTAHYYDHHSHSIVRF